MLFGLTIVVVLLVVTQPVISGGDYRPALASSDNLKKQVYHLSDTIGQQSSLVDRLDVSAEYIFAQLSQYNNNVSFQDFDVQGELYRNVVVEIDGKKQCGTYVIGAHYDTYGSLPGVDDNSSGVAGLIELNRLFSKNKPLCDVQLVAFTLEEPPYFRTKNMGSYVHAKSLMDKKIGVKLMISLEMIGYFNDAAGSQDYPVAGMQYLYSQTGNFISLVGDLSQISEIRFIKQQMRKATDLPVYSINAPAAVVGIDFSDHLNYWHFDYPAIMVSDTAFNRNKNYHSENDTAEKLDYLRMAKVVDGVYYSLLAHMNQ